MATLATGLIDRLGLVADRIIKYFDRASWLASRSTRVGCSEASALWDGAHYSLSTFKLAGIKSGQVVEAVPDSGAMRRGRRFEGPIIQEFADQTGLPVEQWPQDWVIEHPDRAWRLGATPDAIVDFGEELGTAQVKTANEWGYKTWPRGDEGQLTVPAQFAVQTQGELACTGLNRGVLIVLFGFDMDRLEIIPFERHEKFIASLGERLKWFWDLLDRGEMPEPDGSDATTDYLRQLYPDDGGPTRRLPGASCLVAQELAEVAEVRKAAEKREAALKNQMVAWIGESTWAETPDGRAFSYKSQSRSGIDRDKLREDFPEAFKACSTTGSHRVLRAINTLPIEALTK